MKTYPTTVKDINLGKWGKISFKYWLYRPDPPAITESYVDTFAPLIPRGTFAIDIGAFIGDTTIPMALVAGPDGMILAVEPSPPSHQILLDNISANHLANVSVCHKAIMTKEGLSTLHYTDAGFINGGFSSSLDAKPKGCGNNFPMIVIGVDLTKLLKSQFSHWLPKLSFVKIDTEGYDKEILRANRQLFMELHPTILVEVYPFLSKREREDFLGIVSGMGYGWEGGDEVFLELNPESHDVICRPI